MAVVPLSKSKHSELKLGGFDLSVFSGVPSLPVYFNEIKHVACDHPLFFNFNDNVCELRLLCSIGSSSSSAWITDDGKWVGSYVPAFLRHQPFSAHAIDGGEEVGIFLDDSSPRLTDGLSPLFENSEPTELLKKIIASMKQIYKVGRTTQQALDCIARLNIIQPWEAKIKSRDSEEISITGLQRIDEKALSELAADQLSELNDAHALPLIYGQLFSMRNLDKLVSLQNNKLASSLGAELGFSLSTSDQVDFEAGSSEAILDFDKL